MENSDDNDVMRKQRTNSYLRHAENVSNTSKKKKERRKPTQILLER